MRITATTQLYGIVGEPIRHSQSPAMHNLAMEKLGIDGVFLAFEGNLSNIEEIFRGFRALGLKGGSVTMPVKSAAASLVDRLSREAQLIGAINAFKNEDGVLVGYNTDGMGFVMMLEEHRVPYRGKKIVQAGVGGAGRAIAVQLALSGAGELAVCDIDRDMAEQTAGLLAKEVPGCRVRVCGADEESLRGELAGGADVFIDCTPLGMAPREGQSLLNSFEGISRELTVVDICYVPEKTRLLKLAQAHGCRILNGLDMVYNQGAKAFEIWTGQRMPLEYVRANCGEPGQG